MKQLILLLILSCFSHLSFGANWCASNANLACMKNAINGEARGEGYNGMLMIGKTIATRMARGYKSSVCKVVSGAAFATKSSYPTSGAANKAANANIAKAAQKACAMGDQGVTHFHSFKNKFATKWSKKFSYVGKVGRHYFFNAPSYVKAAYEMDQDGDAMLDQLIDGGDNEPELIQEPDYIDPDTVNEEPVTIEI